MNKVNLELLLNSGLNYVHQYFLNYCNKLIKEQRRLDLQIKLRNICNNFRRTQKLTKFILINYKNSLEQLSYVDTETFKICLRELNKVITLYSKYYEDNGIRKS